jgi:hypothetical protein
MNARTYFGNLSSLFFLHAMVLQTVPVSERARPLEAINDDFKLIETFLPDLYSVITAFVLKFNRFVDIDGRIFITILRFAASSDELPTHALEALVGPEISSRLETVWNSSNAPSPDLAKLLSYRPTNEDSESSSSQPRTKISHHLRSFRSTTKSLTTNLRLCMSTSQARARFRLLHDWNSVKTLRFPIQNTGTRTIAPSYLSIWEEKPRRVLGNVHARNNCGKINAS